MLDQASCDADFTLSEAVSSQDSQIKSQTHKLWLKNFRNAALSFPTDILVSAISFSTIRTKQVLSCFYLAGAMSEKLTLVFFFGITIAVSAAEL